MFPKPHCNAVHFLAKLTGGGYPGLIVADADSPKPRRTSSRKCAGFEKTVEMSGFRDFSNNNHIRTVYVEKPRDAEHRVKRGRIGRTQ